MEGREGVVMSDFCFIQALLFNNISKTGYWDIEKIFLSRYVSINQQKDQHPEIVCKLTYWFNEFLHKFCHMVLDLNVEKAQLPLTTTGKAQDFRHC